jgi:hypothetical protein
MLLANIVLVIVVSVVGGCGQKETSNSLQCMMRSSRSSSENYRAIEPLLLLLLLLSLPVDVNVVPPEIPWYIAGVH